MAGALVTIATIVAGLYAYNTVNHDAPSHMAMTDHRNWAFGTAALFALITLWSFKTFNKEKVSMAFLAVLVIATCLLTTTAFKGGELVYRYGMGVMSMPSNAGGHDDHEHADGKGHGSPKETNQKHDGHDHAH